MDPLPLYALGVSRASHVITLRHAATAQVKYKMADGVTHEMHYIVYNADRGLLITYPKLLSIPAERIGDAKYIAKALWRFVSMRVPRDMPRAWYARQARATICYVMMC